MQSSNIVSSVLAKFEMVVCSVGLGVDFKALGIESIPKKYGIEQSHWSVPGNHTVS